MKKVLSIIIVSVILILSTATTAFASYKEGRLDKYRVWGESEVKQRTAYSETVLEWNGEVTISATYAYVNLTTLKTGTISQGNSHNNRVSVSFSAPTNCRSIRIDASHSARAVGQTWTATTRAIY